MEQTLYYLKTRCKYLSMLINGLKRKSKTTKIDDREYHLTLGRKREIEKLILIINDSKLLGEHTQKELKKIKELNDFRNATKHMKKIEELEKIDLDKLEKVEFTIAKDCKFVGFDTPIKRKSK